MKKILIFQWFKCGNEAREQELVDCVNHNLSIGFDEVLIFNDDVEPMFHGKNIINIPSIGRLTYRDFINIVKDPGNYGSLIVLTNTDVKLDRRILSLNEILKERTLIAISRYESNGMLADDPWCTQDCWALISQPIHKSIIHQCDIPLGLPGCEIRFSEIIFNAGFSVFNPCLDIKNLHVHSNQAPHQDEDRLYGAYLFTPACTLKDIINEDKSVAPTLCYLTSFAPKLFSLH